MCGPDKHIKAPRVAVAFQWLVRALSKACEHFFTHLSLCLYVTVVVNQRINIHADCVTAAPGSYAHHNLMALLSNTVSVSTCD